MRRLLAAADSGEDVAAEALAKEAARLRMTYAIEAASAEWVNDAGAQDTASYRWIFETEAVRACAALQMRALPACVRLCVCGVCASVRGKASPPAFGAP